MRTKPLSDKLLVDLGKRLEEFGYIPKIKRQSFRRKTDSGWTSIHIGFIRLADTCGVNMDVNIRFDDVEELIEEYSELVVKPKKGKSDRATLGHLMGNLTIGQPIRWYIESESDIPDVIDSMVEEYKKNGEPYLTQYSSMEKVYKLVSRDDKEVWSHSSLHNSRAMTAVAIAYLLKYQDIKDLISAKTKFLEERDDFGLEDFRNFCQCLNLKDVKNENA